MDQTQDLDRLFGTGHWQADESLFNRPGAMGLVLGGGIPAGGGNHLVIADGSAIDADPMAQGAAGRFG